MPDRFNQAKRLGEKWRPPLFVLKAGALADFAAAVRRFLDLQAGSCWRDLARILPQLSGKLLDVGCGAQPYRPLLGKSIVYTGIDTTDAKSHFGYEISDTIYFDGDRFPVADGQFDVVLCTETIEHVFDIRQFLAELHRCLADNGRLIITVPMSARWHFIPHDYWRYTPASLLKLLEASGFAEVEVFARGNAVTVACYKTMALILPFAFPQGHGPAAALALRLVGLLLSPALLTLAIIANVSYGVGDGDDCLGYTVLARRRGNSGVGESAGAR